MEQWTKRHLRQTPESKTIGKRIKERKRKCSPIESLSVFNIKVTTLKGCRKEIFKSCVKIGIGYIIKIIINK